MTRIYADESRSRGTPHPRHPLPAAPRGAWRDAYIAAPQHSICAASGILTVNVRMVAPARPASKPRTRSAPVVASAIITSLPSMYAHLSYLETLATGEAARAHDRSVARRLAAARFPVSKTMAGWNWSWPKKINRMQFEHLLQLGFLQAHANVVLLGPTGVGKTHLASALGHAAWLHRHAV